MGCPRSQRPQAFRGPRALRRTGGIELVARAEKAERLSPRVRQIRSGESRALLREKNPGPCIRSGDHSQREEDRSRSAQRTRISQNPGRVRELRLLLLVFCRRAAQAQPLEGCLADSGDFARIRRIQQGPQAPGIQLRRPDGRLRLHAGGWNGERSRRRLFPLSEDPAGARESQDVKFPFGPTRAADLKLHRNARTWSTIPTLTPTKGRPVNREAVTPRRKASLKTPTGLGEGATKDISGALNALLADVFALYMKTKNFHWHMSGPHFRDYHLLLDEQADQIYAITDTIAERVRKLGGTTLRSIKHVSALQRIDDNDADYVTPLDMLAELRDDNERLAGFMRAAHAVCDEHGDVATASLLEVWIDEAEKRVWFLFEAGRRRKED